MRPTLPPALRHADFRLFGLGYSISSMGSQFTQLAMAWQMYELTNSPLQVGLLGLARFVPQASLGLVGGVLADALDRRRLLIGTQIGQFTISLVLAILTLTGAVTPVVLYLGVAVLALFSALDNPTRISVVPNLVPPQHLASGMAVMNLSTKTGSVLGPPVAGVAILVGGPALCYAADAASWLALLVALLLLKGNTQTVRARGSLSLRSIGPGIQYVRARPVILSVLFLDFGAQLLGTNRALLPVYARDILEVGAPGLGLLYAASSLGAVLAGTTISIRTPMRRMGMLVLVGVAIFALSSAVFALSRMFWLSLLMMATAGAGNSLSTILRGTITQLDTPDGLRGRVASVGNLFTSSGPRLGQAQSGALAELAGVPVAAFAGALATLGLIGVIGVVSPLRAYEAPDTRDGRVVVTPASSTQV